MGPKSTIMIAQLKLMFPVALSQRRINFIHKMKINRLKERIEKNSFEG